MHLAAVILAANVATGTPPPHCIFDRARNVYECPTPNHVCPEGKQCVFGCPGGWRLVSGEARCTFSPGEPPTAVHK
jgi:hypothetical protein